uniref:Uncharacterized protein n=1 Tax=Arundo donax TaxID=35708 RepID=A0A0A9E0B6_ARUDO
MPAGPFFGGTTRVRRLPLGSDLLLRWKEVGGRIGSRGS